jgi:MFS family permease
MSKLMLGIRRRIIILGFVSLLNDIAGEAIHPLLPLFLVNVLLAPVAAIGLIEGIADSSSSILRVVAGWWSDRTGRRKPFIIAGYTAAALARGTLAFAGSWLHVLLLRFTDRAGKGIRTAPRDAIIAETPKRLRGLAFGFHRAMDKTGAIIGPLIALALLAFIGFREIFLLMLIPGIASVALLAFVNVRPRRPKPVSFRLALGKLSKRCRRFILIAGLFATGYFSYAFLLLRAQQLGATIGTVVGLFLLFSIAYATLLIPLGILSDRIGRKWVIILGYAVFAATCAGFALVGSLTLLLPLFVMFGLSHAVVIIQSAYVADLTVPALRATALGALYTVIGIAALPASLIAGLLWQFISPAATFWFGFCLAATAAALLLIPSRKP